MDLDSLKYADLQQLAKTVGLKANMKAEKLLKALKEHFEQQERSENGNNVGSRDEQTPAEGADEVRASNVTKRRGKAKRKFSDQACPDVGPEQGGSPAQDGATLDEVKDQQRSLKRRKVSSTKDTEIPASDAKENQPESQSMAAHDDAGTEQSGKDVRKKTAGKIPRHEGLLKKKALRPTTPNFKKLHEAHFNKMESIDSYVQRKNKQMEAFRNTVKELKAQSENVVMKPGDTKTQAKPPVSRVTLFSPGVQKSKPSAEKRRFTQIAARKSAVKDSAPFKPTILSTNKINVRFSRETQDNEHKRSLVKTPARMSPMIPFTPTPGRKSEVRTKQETNKTPGTTPFVFSGSCQGESKGVGRHNHRRPQEKKTRSIVRPACFGLSRPLTYKPHKGKLKPFGTTQENPALDKSQTIPSHQKNYKQHQIQTRDDRRIKHTEDRKQKKGKMLDARRGLVMA
ncbi:hypothetical protein NFI96_020180 [Prochilodus magdalenae]|nr:hypothetical protein NFI96_020180 [Prochilodus magdalenae]